MLFSDKYYVTTLSPTRHSFNKGLDTSELISTHVRATQNYLENDK